MGTTSAFINVSLALYYYCVIKLGWVETKIKRIRRWLFLFPIAVGLVFAFVGIPFYGMLFLWCNNTAPWWPDIPIAVAILFTTMTMGSICWFVYQVSYSVIVCIERRQAASQQEVPFSCIADREEIPAICQ